LQKGSETDGRPKLDHRWLVFDVLGLLDGSLNGLKIVIAVCDGLDVPAIGLETLRDVLGEGDLGVTICEMLAVVYASMQ